MNYITKEINKIIKDYHLKSSLLPAEKMNYLYSNIIKHYCIKNTSFIWESFKDYAYYQNSNAWSLIKDYVRENKCIMFFNKSDDKNGFLILNGFELQKIIEESFGFEFYITDENLSYLICFNHHDILYGLGKAKDWIKEVKINEFYR